MTEKEKVIQKNMAKLDISREDAEALWDFDHENGIVPVEVLTIEQKLEKKAKSPINKVKNLKAKAKVDVYKSTIIEEIHQFLVNAHMSTDSVILSPFMVKTGKFVFVDEQGSFYTLALTKNKDKPDGYVNTHRIDPSYEE